MHKLAASLTAMVLLGFAATAQAQHVRFGLYLGLPGPGWYAPYSYYPPAYYSPPVVVQSAPIYAEPRPAPLPSTWYYCADAKAYYPYVKQCPGGWQRVPTVPSP